MSARAVPSPIGRAPDDSPAAMRWAALGDLCHQAWRHIAAAHQRGDVLGELAVWREYSAHRAEYDYLSRVLGKERRG